MLSKPLAVVEQTVSLSVAYNTPSGDFSKMLEAEFQKDDPIEMAVRALGQQAGADGPLRLLSVSDNRVHVVSPLSGQVRQLFEGPFTWEYRLECEPAGEGVEELKAAGKRLINVCHCTVDVNGTIISRGAPCLLR